jgi:hypothetical protein
VCSSCKDMSGVSRQITPQVLLVAWTVGGDELKRAFAAMMAMKKIDVAEIKRGGIKAWGLPSLLRLRAPLSPPHSVILARTWRSHVEARGSSARCAKLNKFSAAPRRSLRWFPKGGSETTAFEDDDEGTSVRSERRKKLGRSFYGCVE